MGHTCDYRFLSDKEVKLCVFVRKELQLDLDVTMAELQGDNDVLDLDELEAMGLNQGSVRAEAIVFRSTSVGLKLKGETTHARSTTRSSCRRRSKRSARWRRDEQQLTRLLEGEGLGGWTPGRWRWKKDSVPASTSVRACHIASMRKFTTGPHRTRHKKTVGPARKSMSLAFAGKLIP